MPLVTKRYSVPPSMLSGALEWWVRYEHRCVKRRVVAPPAPPTIVTPRTANRAEHVAAHDPGADPRKGACDEVVVDARRAIDLVAMLLSKAAGRNLPFMQRLTAYAEGSVFGDERIVFNGLLLAGSAHGTGSSRRWFGYSSRVCAVKTPWPVFANVWIRLAA